MPTFARRPVITSSTTSVELPENNMVGQQRQQISELQFNKLPNPQSFFGVEDTIPKSSDSLFTISIGSNVLDQRSGDG